MDFSRRQFLQSALAASAAAAFPAVWLRAREAAALEACEQGLNLVIVQLDGGNDGINTVIPVSDGTGSNRTVYDNVRPYLRISTSELAATEIDQDPLHNGELALHPHMNQIKSLYDQGNVAVILGTHYDNGNLSHDVSNLIWYRADPTLSNVPGGWIGRTMDELCFGQPNAVPSVDVNSKFSPLFFGRTSTLALQRTEDLSLPIPLALSLSGREAERDLFRQIFAEAYQQLTGAHGFVGNWARSGHSVLSRMEDYRTASYAEAQNLTALFNGAVDHPIAAPTPQRYGLANALRLVFALMRGRQPGNQPLGCRIFRVGIGGFDTHSDQGGHIPLSQKSLNQKIADGFPGELHGRLLHRVDKAIAAFWADLRSVNLHSNTLIMTFTEFGRRIAENGDHNADSGTDHGTASPMFVIGPTKAEAGPDGPFVAGGVYGAYPELHLPDRDGNMIHQLDFRHVYGEILHRWLGLSLDTTNSILGAGGFTYRPLDFLQLRT